MRRPFEPRRAARTRCAAPTRSCISPASCRRCASRTTIAANVDGDARGRRGGARRRRAADPHLEPGGRRAGAAARAAIRRRSAGADQRRTAAASSRANARSRAVDGLRWTMLRPGVVYGPGDRALLPLFRLAQRGHPAAGRPRRRGLHASSTSHDLVRAIAAAVDRPAVGETIFVGHPRSGDDARAARRRARGRRARAPRSSGADGADARSPPSPATSPARCRGKPALINSRRYAELASEGFVCRVDRLRDRLGVVAEIGLREGLADAFAWYRQCGLAVESDGAIRASRRRA